MKSKISGIVKRAASSRSATAYRRASPLFEILPDPTPLELTEARREVEIAKNAFDQAERKADARTSLKSQGIVATRSPTVADRETGRADPPEPRQREAGLSRRAASRRDRPAVESMIRAPIAARCSSGGQRGDPVVPLTTFQAGTPLAPRRHAPLVFRGTVDEIDVGKLKEGMPARIQIGALPEPVRARSPGSRPSRRRRRARPCSTSRSPSSPRKALTLRAGYSANADIVIREKQDVLLVPERLVTIAEGKARSRSRARTRRRPSRKEIKIGLSDGLNIEVAEGLRRTTRWSSVRPRRSSRASRPRAQTETP